MENSFGLCFVANNVFYVLKRNEEREMCNVMLCHVVLCNLMLYNVYWINFRSTGWRAATSAASTAWTSSRLRLPPRTCSSGGSSRNVSQMLTFEMFFYLILPFRIPRRKWNSALLNGFEPKSSLEVLNRWVNTWIKLWRKLLWIMTWT